MTNILISTVLIFGLLHVGFAPPVTQDKSKDKELEENEIGGLEDYMEYHRYLREVVNALESDADFRNKLEKAQEDDIRSGKIAEELKFVAHHVRTRLDEIKRVELERLKKLTEKKRQLEQQTNDEHDTHGHLDHQNPHSFEIEDLKKLIAKTTQDLAEADKKRRDEFKEYELQKEYEKQKKLNETNEEERIRLEKEFREKEQKHKQHEKLHEPGHKAQLEEVWEEQDQMQQEFDPKMFFMLHDLDGNGLWDQDEVKALFIKELDKMYNAGAAEDDMRERAEEMERMRESVFREVDVNRDGFIDYEEFLAQTRRNDFQQDHGWQGLDEQRPYTDEELAEYIRQHEAERIRQGYPPSQYPHQPQMHPGQVPPAVYQQVQPGQGQQGHYQGNMPPHPGMQYNAQYQPPPNQQPGVQHPNQQYQQYQQPNQQFQQPNQYQQQNQQYQQPNQQYRQPNQQFQQPNQQFQQPNQQFQQPNQQFQQPNIQYQQPQPPQQGQNNHQSQSPQQAQQPQQPHQGQNNQQPPPSQQGQNNQQQAPQPDKPASEPKPADINQQQNKQPDPQVNMV